MARESIEVVINPDGSITIEAVGYTGGACVEATRALEAALGVQAGKRKLKPEFQRRAVVGKVTR